MERKDAFSKVLTVTGTIFAFLPFVAPLVFSIVRLVESGRFRFDYLMPAEVFFLFIIGGALLVWAALRAKRWLKLIAWGLGIAIAFLLGFQGLAILTGLASGAYEAEGWRFALVLAGMGLCYLGMILAGVGGSLLTRDLFKK